MKEITVISSLDQLKEVTGFINGQLSELKCPDELRIQIDVAVDEIFGNIIHYAYDPDTGPVTVQFSTLESPKGAVITFIDSGIPFDPFQTESPVLSEPLKQRKIGGLGIYIVKMTMDEASYRYEDGQNKLTIIKYI